jgi:hypothetical protein
MSTTLIFPSLSGWEATRDTLHSYSQVLGVVPRAHAKFHPRWWHISLKVEPDGMVTERMPLPQGDSFWLKMDLRQHKVLLATSRGQVREFSMREGLSASAFGDQVLAAVAELGLTADYARGKFENDQPGQYDPAMAERYLTALTYADRLLKQHRAGLSGEVGPVQLWPHGFDLAFEWFGSRVVESDEGGQVKKHPSQLNFGFSPGEPSHPGPYFYCNPWPFEAGRLLGQPLPSGARWFTEGWQGSILPYAALVGDGRAGEKLLAYAQAVYDLAAPTLSA